MLSLKKYKKKNLGIKKNEYRLVILGWLLDFGKCK